MPQSATFRSELPAAPAHRYRGSAGNVEAGGNRRHRRPPTSSGANRERQETSRSERQGRARHRRLARHRPADGRRRWARWVRASRVTARKQDELDAARAHLEASGHRVPDDRRRPRRSSRRSRRSSTRCSTRWGQIDILVNNAGCNWAAPAEDYPDDGWRKVMNLNVDAQFFLTREVGRRSMIPRRSGKIVNIASIAGLFGNPPEWEMQTIAYNTSKGALVNMTRALAAEWGPYNINVNAICPGFFPSKMTKVTLERIDREVLDADAARAARRRRGSQGLRRVPRVGSLAPRHRTGDRRRRRRSRRSEHGSRSAPIRARRSSRPCIRSTRRRSPRTCARTSRRFAGALDVEQFQGGQSNPTYRVTAGDRRYVLRRKPPGKLLPSAHAIEREYRVMAALAGHRRSRREDDRAVRRRRGDRHRVLRDGVRRGPHPLGPDAARHDARSARAHYDELNRVHRRAASGRLSRRSGLADFGKPGNYIERQIARWSKQYEAAAPSAFRRWTR